MQHTVRKAQAGQISLRVLANVAYGAACCGRSAILRLPFAVLAKATERRLIEFNSQSIANTAWAFATGNCRDEKLCAALALSAGWRLSEFHPQELANTAWAFATLNYRERELCAALALEAERRLSDFNLSSVWMALWAFAQREHVLVS